MKTKARIPRWMLAACLLGLFVALALNLSSVTAVDSAVYGLISRLQCGFSTGLFKAATALVHPVTLLAVSLGLIFIVRQRTYWAPIFSNLAISVMLNLGLKSLFARPRPVEVVHFITETGYSFPSGHSMAAVAFYGFIIYLARQSSLQRRTKNLLTALLLGLILLVGASRVYLGVHYFTDVLGGFLVSGAYLIVFTGFVHTYFQEGKAVADSRAARGKRQSLAMSFAHAVDGVLAGLKAERNLLIHFGAAALVVVFGFLLQISALQWAVCALACAVVMAAELMNTAVETIVDLISPEYSDKAKLAKDTAAGAVLLAAIGAAVAGAIIFIPKMISVL